MRCVVQRLCTLSFFSLVVLFHSTQLLAQPSVFAAPIDALVGQFGYEAGGWRVDRHPRLLGDVNGDGRVDIVGFGNGGVGVALGQADGSFAAPIDALVGQFGYEAGGWRVDPRLLGDVNGDGRADIVGFGNGGVGVALAAAPAPVEPTPHNSANLFITEMVIADDFDGGPSNWGEFCIFVTGEDGRRLTRIFDCTRAFRDGCRSGGRRVPCSYRITPADGGEVFLQSPTGQATVTINLRERDSGWDTDAECLQDVVLDFSHAYDDEVNCPGRNKIKYRVEPVEASPGEQTWFVLSDVTIHTSFEPLLSPNDDGEFCVFIEAGGRPLTSAYDCTQTLEAGFEHPLNSGEGYGPIPAESSRATIHLRERDAGWDDEADCVQSVILRPGPGEVGCPGQNVVRYVVGNDLNQLLSSRPTRRVVDRRQPRIVSFERTPVDGIIERGGSAELRWRVECALGCDVSLVGVGTNLQNQPLMGSTTVSPQQSTTYTLTADNQGFTHKETIRVWIRPEPAAVGTFYYFKTFCEGSLGAPGSCEHCFSSECRTYTVFATTRDAALAEVRAQNSNCRIDEIQGGDEPTACDAFNRECDRLCGL